MVAETDVVETENPFRKPFEIDDTDARSLGEIKRRRTCCTLSIYFAVATTQMSRIFQKENPFVLTNIRRYYKSKVLTGGVV